MIYIITPCTRPENLYIIKKTIPKECNWVIVYDNSVSVKTQIENAIILHSPFTGDFGNPNRNFALDNVNLENDDWVYILDDDNILHPKWYEVVSQNINYEYDIMTWGQLTGYNDIRLLPTKYPKIGNIDTASYMINGKIMKTLRYSMQRGADGELAEQVAKNGKVFMIDEYLCYYNYLNFSLNRFDKSHVRVAEWQTLWS